MLIVRKLQNLKNTRMFNWRPIITSNYCSGIIACIVINVCFQWSCWTFKPRGVWLWVSTDKTRVTSEFSFIWGTDGRGEDKTTLNLSQRGPQRRHTCVLFKTHHKGHKGRVGVLLVVLLNDITQKTSALENMSSEEYKFFFSVRSQANTNSRGIL